MSKKQSIRDFIKETFTNFANSLSVNENQRLLENKFIQSCKYRDNRLFNSLLERVNINCVSWSKDDINGIYGTTPLIAASIARNLTAVEVLCKRGAKLDIREINGNTALQHASKHSYNQIVDTLIRSGADINNRNIAGETALINAVYSDNNLTVVKYLIINGADLNSQDVDGWTALMAAAHGGDNELVSLLIKTGADTHLVNNKGLRNCDIAKIHNHVTTMYLLDKDSIREQNESGETCLMRAVHEKDENAVLFLHDKEADFNLKNISGYSPLDVLIEYNDLPERLQSLKEKLILEKLTEEDSDDLNNSL